MAAAILAPELGLDTNQDWGPSRRLLLAAGLGILAAIAIEGLLRKGGRVHLWVEHALAPGRGGRIVDALTADLGRYAWIRGLRQTRSRWEHGLTSLVQRSAFLERTVGTRRKRVVLAAWGAFALVAVTYAWFASVGTWSSWPATSAYHDMQADAFLHGQTYLRIDPDPRLLALPNPYDPEARADIAHVWDASLFQGRYYLYWGPVPALVIAPMKALGLRVEDNALTFLFMVGTLFWVTRILTRTWRDHFHDLSGWVVVAAVLTIGWANPAPWLLSSPHVYESAIAGGQFFLLMGVNALYPHLAPDGGRLRDLLWAGISFALSAGTRSNLAPAILIASGIVVAHILVHRVRGDIRWARSLVAYLTPLVLAAAALGAYNQVRFGSSLEFGQLYALTSFDSGSLPATEFSLGNVAPNLYNYLLNPVRTLSVFPYLKPNWGGVGSSVLRIRAPEGYLSWQTSGVLVVAPFVVFALRAALSLRGRQLGAALNGDRSSQIRWLTGVLLGIALAAFAVLQVFVAASMRYQSDFMTSLLLAAALGLWGGLAERARSGRTGALWALTGLILMAWTAAAGLLLGVTGPHSRFENLNPELFDRLTRFFTL